MRPLLVPDRILGEDFRLRMERFGLISENAHKNWDLSERDENAIRTAEQLLGLALEVLRELPQYAVLGERYTPALSAKVRHVLWVATGAPDSARPVDVSGPCVECGTTTEGAKP